MFIEQNARELIFKKNLEEFCDLLTQNQIRFLIFKGSALAYDFYKNPALRPRTDTDLLIAKSDLEVLRILLLNSGYEWVPNQMEILGQTVFTKKTGSLHMIYDVHWQVFAPYPLRDLFLFEELWSSRKKISQLEAYTVSDQYALLLSGVHWVAHHLLAPEPYWIEDIQKIAFGRGPEWWDGVKKICQQRGLQKIMEQTLIASEILSPWVDGELSFVSEPLDYLLKEKRSAWSDLRQDIKSMSYVEIFQFFKKHLFPSAIYMRSKYKFRSDVFLPVYYFWRLLSGFKKFFQPW